MDPYIKEWPDQVAADFCQHLIQRFDQDKRVKADPQPDYSTRQFLLLSGLKDWSDEVRRLDNLVNESCKRYFRVPKQYRSAAPAVWGNDGYLIARYEPGDICVLHADGQCTTPPQNQLRLATFLLYLNTLTKGGETFFPLQGQKIAPLAGKVVIFPPTHTHPHEVLAAKEARYILQTWIVDPNILVIPNKGKHR